MSAVVDSQGRRYSGEALHHRARIAALTRSRAVDDPELLEAKRSLLVAMVVSRLRRVVAEAGPLTDDEIATVVAAADGSEW